MDNLNKALNSLAKKYEILGEYYIQIGVISAETKRKTIIDVGLTNAELMYIHENGSAFNNLPARPVLEKTIKYAKTTLLDKTLKNCIDGITHGWDRQQIEDELNKLCMRMQNYARKGMLRNELGLAPNKPSTIKRKGSDVPLVDTGQLARSITCQLVRK